MDAILRYQGLYGDQQLPMVSDFIHMEPLEERSKIYSWEIEEHLHTDLVQLFIIQAGEGVLVSERKKTEIKSPCIITIPANVLHGFQFKPEMLGTVITFSTGFLDSLLREKPDINKEINRLCRFSFDHNSEGFKSLLRLKEHIHRELFEEAPEKLLALRACFELFYLELYREKFRTTSQELISNNRSLKYFQQFQDLIRQHAQSLLSIKDFADALGITQTHLNRVCHTVSGKSALKVVQDFTMNEAKKYLLNTSYSIAEVAYFLNFNDPAYFSRLFKKRVGVAPGEFRKG
ncbi:AraC family transcriptional activator of pobA [Flavobacteriaceae bacterium MAR_2009_75]|nr:AraC family transcriptional activator of pobA [Flavobacteriaceae bacterium MAR_2009_75]